MGKLINSRSLALWQKSITNKQRNQPTSKRVVPFAGRDDSDNPSTIDRACDMEPGRCYNTGQFLIGRFLAFDLTEQVFLFG
jgi:hypothetical protein